MGDKETVPEAHCEVPEYEREDLTTPPQDVYEFAEEVDDGSEWGRDETGG